MPIMCLICDKLFSSQSSLNRHIKKVHQKVPEPVSYGQDSKYHSRCMEPNCDNVFTNNKGLMNHLQNIHLMKFETEILFMDTMNDFENWKVSIESKINVSYIFKSKHVSTIGEILYYKCNRSKTGYVPKENEQRSRLLKSQGSCKISNACTSEIKVTKENNRIVVEYQKIHYNHNFDLQHIRLPQIEKKSIATKMMNGVTPQRILKSTRDNIGENLKRIDLLNLTDIKNIKNSYGLEIEDGKRDPNDAISIALFVEECKQLKENPILFYKEQGKEHDNLRKEDFCLIVMNSFQKQMLRQFPTIITVDSTHGLNGYEFEMTTIMVLDEYHHGFPIAEKFTNRKDTIVQRVFYSAVKEAAGAVHCNFFMSDMADVFFNAWIAVMGSPYPQHFYCAWHIDRAWQSNLTKISNSEKRSEVYKILKILQQETSECNFVAALGNAIKFMCNNKEMKNFGEYFTNTYGHNYRKWAYYFRKECSINTNMHLESMHKVIKYFYLQRKTVKRLDKGLAQVLNYVRDKSVERIIRLTKGENTKITRQLSHSHNEALKDLNNYLIAHKKTHWEISKNEQIYLVTQLMEAKCCELMCVFCEACNHMFSCDCKFFTNKRIICKHIHMLCDEFKNGGKLGNNASDHKKILISEALSAISNIRETPTVVNHNVDNIKKLIANIEMINFEDLDDTVMSKIHQHLLIINNVAKCTNTNEEFESRTKSTKRVIDTQIRFTSTKKKCISRKASLKRPSTHEAAIIQENLSHSPGESLKHATTSHSSDHQYSKFS